MVVTRLVQVNAHGRPVGQDHPKAALSDREVSIMRSLREQGWSYPALVEKFETVSIWAVGRICRHERRAAIPVRTKKVKE